MPLTNFGKTVSNKVWNSIKQHYSGIELFIVITVNKKKGWTVTDYNIICMDKIGLTYSSKLLGAEDKSPEGERFGEICSSVIASTNVSVISLITTRPLPINGQQSPGCILGYEM